MKLPKTREQDMIYFDQPFQEAINEGVGMTGLMLPVNRAKAEATGLMLAFINLVQSWLELRGLRMPRMNVTIDSEVTAEEIFRLLPPGTKLDKVEVEDGKTLVNLSTTSVDQDYEIDIQIKPTNTYNGSADELTARRKAAEEAELEAKRAAEPKPSKKKASVYPTDYEEIKSLERLTLSKLINDINLDATLGEIRMKAREPLHELQIKVCKELGIKYEEVTKDN